VVGAALILLGVAVGVVVGNGARVTDPTVQAGIVGAVAGLVGGIAGAAMGAWSAGRLTDRTLDDARIAREEARLEARREQFLDVRRTAIIDLLRVTTEGFEDALSNGERGPEALAKRREEPLRLGIEHTLRVLSLVAPDLALDSARRYVDANDTAIRECLAWASIPGERESRRMPERTKRAIERRGEALAWFVSNSVFHLGVIAYTEEALARAIHKIEEERIRSASSKSADPRPSEEADVVTPDAAAGAGRAG
jgi:hypothetical protein